MKRNIVGLSVPVTKKGELIFFQVNVPQDVDRIAGIEAGICGITGLDGIELSDKFQAGIIKVQGEHTADLCYSREIYFGAGFLEKTTPGFVDTLVSPVSGKGMQELMITNCYTFYGCYEDTLGKQLNRNLSYNIGLYLSTERNTATEKTIDHDTATGK